MSIFGYSRISWQGYKSQLQFYKNKLNEFNLSPENTEKDILLKMQKQGNENEQKALNCVLNDLRDILPKTLPLKKKWMYSNLLNSIIYLWGTGKVSSRINVKKDFYQNIKRKNPKVNPLLVHELFPLALIIYDWHYKTAIGMQEWYSNMKRKYPNENIGKPFKEGITTIKYNDALIKANEREIIPKAEFDENLVAIQNLFKVWRGRELKQKRSLRKKTK